MIITYAFCKNITINKNYLIGWNHTIRIAICEIREINLNWILWLINKEKIRIEIARSRDLCSSQITVTLIRCRNPVIFLYCPISKLIIQRISYHIESKYFWIQTVRIRRIDRDRSCFVLIFLGKVNIFCYLIKQKIGN